MERVSRTWTVAMVGLISLLALFAAVSLRNTRRLNDDGEWVSHTYEVTVALEKLSDDIGKAQSLELAYLISGDDAVRAEIFSIITTARRTLETLAALTADNAEQQARIPQFKRGIDRLEQFWRETTETRREKGFDAARETTVAAQSRALSDDLRKQLAQMERSERSLLRARSQGRADRYGVAMVSALISGAGAVLGVAAFSILFRRYVGVRMQAAALLRQNEERFRALVEQVRDYAIFTTDPEGRATSWNEGVRRVLGFEEDDFIGQDIVAEIFTPEDVREGVAEKELELAASEGRAGDDRWMRRKDGSRFFAAGATTSLKDEQGGLLGFIKVMRDQTERHYLERELRQAAADLSEADRRKNEFLAVLAHELRNPLSALQNALEIARLKGDDPETRGRTLDLMVRQLTQLVRLVDDLMDVSRITRGKIELRKERISLEAVLNNALETSRPLIAAMGHRLTTALPPPTLEIDGDFTRLAQVFTNLLNNAAKYTERGGEIGLTAEARNGEAVVAIRDNGIGIDAEELERVFSMFAQVDRSIRKAQGGLGIGLTLANQLVEMHGGRIDAKSEGLGRGSEFVVRLPIAVPATGPGQHLSGPAVPIGARRVLVVDDVRDNAESLAQMLRLHGHDAHVEFDGEATLVAAGALRPEVILLDIGLPKLSGLEVCRRIREQVWADNVLIIALTGWAQGEDRQRTREAGFDAHLVKPVRPDMLFKLFAEHSGKGDQPRSDDEGD